MAKLKLRIAKVNMVNPSTKKKGFATRVITNGTASFDDVCDDAAEDTTFNVDEIRAAAGIFCRAAAKMLKQGYIVDFGPVGKLYPSCSSGWFEKAEDMCLSDVKPSLYFRPSDDVSAAISGASIVWAKASEQDEEEGTGSSSTGGTTTGDEPVIERP